jgi:hypothetical protein
MSLKNIVLFWLFVSNIICFMLSIVIANASSALFYFTTGFLCLNLIFCYWIYRSEAHTSQYVFLDVIPTKYVYMMFWFQLLILSFSYFDIFAFAAKSVIFSYLSCLAYMGLCLWISGRFLEKLKSIFIVKVILFLVKLMKTKLKLNQR